MIEKEIIKWGIKIESLKLANYILHLFVMPLQQPSYSLRILLHSLHDLVILLRIFWNSKALLCIKNIKVIKQKHYIYKYCCSIWLHKPPVIHTVALEFMLFYLMYPSWGYQDQCQTYIVLDCLVDEWVWSIYDQELLASPFIRRDCS